MKVMERAEKEAEADRLRNIPLEEIPQSECTCDVCKNSCQFRPCWGTPSNIKKLIEHGYAKRLMLDWWGDEDGDHHNVLLIVPALVGSEGAPAPFNPIGICTFFRNELCEIHQIKPIEGKIVSHDNISDKHGVHKRIALSWDTEEGKQLVKEWKEIVGCDEDINDPTSIIDMFDFVLETLKRGFLKR
jgi:hypothetical protein